MQPGTDSAVLFGRGVEIKTPDQLTQMRRAGLVVAETLELVTAAVAEASTRVTTTADLDVLAEEHIRARGAVPSFLGYQGFPATICVSVNEQVVHGIPGSQELEPGDLVSVDCGAIVDGWHGDAAATVTVGGEPPADVARLQRVTETALWRGIAAARPGGRVTDVSAAVESEVRSHDTYGAGPRLGIVEDYVGHGIGTAMHQPPNVPNRGRAGRGARLVPGMAIAIEPMLTLGGPETTVLADDWTVVTADGSWAAHFEHTVAVTQAGPWVLTAPDGGRAKLTALGAPYGGPD